MKKYISMAVVAALSMGIIPNGVYAAEIADVIEQEKQEIELTEEIVEIAEREEQTEVDDVGQDAEQVKEDLEETVDETEKQEETDEEDKQIEETTEETEVDEQEQQTEEIEEVEEKEELTEEVVEETEETEETKAEVEKTEEQTDEETEKGAEEAPAEEITPTQQPVRVARASAARAGELTLTGDNENEDKYTITGYDLVVINDFNLNGKELTISNANVSLSGTISGGGTIAFENCTIENSVTLKNSSTIGVWYESKFTNGGVLENTGVISIFKSEFQNDGEITSSGDTAEIRIEQSTFNNSGTVTNSNNGRIEINGEKNTFDNNNIVTNDSGGKIQIFGGSTFNNSKTVTNSNNGRIEVSGGAIFDNSGTVTNSANAGSDYQGDGGIRILGAGRMTNSGTMINDGGYLEIGNDSTGATGRFENAGTVENNNNGDITIAQASSEFINGESGIVENNASFVVDSGSVTNGGSFTNNHEIIVSDSDYVADLVNLGLEGNGKIVYKMDFFPFYFQAEYDNDNQTGEPTGNRITYIDEGDTTAFNPDGMNVDGFGYSFVDGKLTITDDVIFDVRVDFSAVKEIVVEQDAIADFKESYIELGEDSRVTVEGELKGSSVKADNITVAKEAVVEAEYVTAMENTTIEGKVTAIGVTAFGNIEIGTGATVETQTVRAGDMTISGTVTASSYISVDNLMTVKEGATVKGNSVQIDGIFNPDDETSQGGDLNIEKGGKLEVTNFLSVNNNAMVEGELIGNQVNVFNDMEVGGSVTANEGISVNNLTVKEGATVKGNSVQINGIRNPDDGTFQGGDLNIEKGGSLEVTNLTVNNNATVEGSVTANEGISVNNLITVKKGATVKGNSVQINGIWNPGDGTLQGGDLNIEKGASLEVTDYLTVQNNATVEGEITAERLSANRLSVEGTISAKKPVVLGESIALGKEASIDAPNIVLDSEDEMLGKKFQEVLKEHIDEEKYEVKEVEGQYMIVDRNTEEPAEDVGTIGKPLEPEPPIEPDKPTEPDPDKPTKPDEPKPDEPKPDEPKPDKPTTPVEPEKPVTSSGGGGSRSEKYYEVTLEKTEGGTVTLSRTRAAKGNSVMVEAQADAGYQVESVKVVDAKGENIDVKDSRFYMPSSDVTVRVNFEKIEEKVEKIEEKTESLEIPEKVEEIEEKVEENCPSSDFSDLKQDAWYHQAVDFAIQNGLMMGYGAGQFAPEENVTRAQVAQILYHMENKPNIKQTGKFRDVEDSAWYAKAVNWAAQEGIVSGYGNGQFAPEENVTREQLAVMLWLYAQKPAGNGKELTFVDANKVSDYAAEAVRWAVENGILNGYENGTLQPNGYASRSQVAQMFLNFTK